MWRESFKRRSGGYYGKYAGTLKRSEGGGSSGRDNLALSHHGVLSRAVVISVFTIID